MTDKMTHCQPVDQILQIDPWLSDYRDDLCLRATNYQTAREGIRKSAGSLLNFSNAHHYFGFHREDKHWIYREWAPAAEALFLVGDFNDWQPHTHPLTPLKDGIWEIQLPEDALAHEQKIKVIVRYQGEDHYKIPLYIRAVQQQRLEDGNIDWVGLIWDPTPFAWTDDNFRHNLQTKRQSAPLIYEAHVGMAQEEGRVGSYREFADQILPRIKEAGYNTVQLMAIMQHPYYGSFGYHVSNFYAASHWFGTPEDLKYLIDRAHALDLRVLMDLVHSHAVKNTVEGINQFDGTQTQFFYEGAQGMHNHWDSMCFNYGKREVLQFLLSNLRFWMEEYHFDGFRFDGITSMLYWDHAMGTSFTSYDQYFSMNTNTDAVTYLCLASDLVHTLNPNAILIAEDMSGMPGLCLPLEEAGIGFDYRLAMGVPDLWVRNMQKNDFHWDMNELYYELTTRRPQEKKIAYAESHDQALVGDKTLFFWLADAESYWHMRKDDNHYIIERAIALHKMIRLITIATGGDGYLNFMGNEFGHPEWIDFPRAENNWSFHYCRRQWSLVDDPDLRYGHLAAFDHDMLQLVSEAQLFGSSGMQLLWIDQDRKILAYRKNNYVFLFNFHPTNSYEKFYLPVHAPGNYRVVFSTDRSSYGGFDRIDETVIYHTKPLAQSDCSECLVIYSPSRTALVLRRQDWSETQEEDDDEKAIEQMIEAERIAQQTLKERKERSKKRK